MKNIEKYGLIADGITDNSMIFATIINDLSHNGGTLHLSDGHYCISCSLELPRNVSLVMEPGAVLQALPEFIGDAVVVKGIEKEHGQHGCYGVIRGGTINGGKHDVTGIQVKYACRLHISDLEIRNACKKGIHIGTEGWYEVNISNVRCHLDMDVKHSPGSIGIHYDRCTDSYVSMAVIIGYETGVRSDSSSNDFQQIHVWNVPAHGPLKICYHCNGWNDSWNQCYADAPFDGDNTCYGWLVEKPFNRITNGRCYCNSFTVDAMPVGIHITDGGTHGTYMSNHFTAGKEHRIAAAFSGNFDSACIFGNSFDPGVISGRVCQIPSGGGGVSSMPEITIAGGTKTIIVPEPK